MTENFGYVSMRFFYFSSFPCQLVSLHKVQNVTATFQISSDSFGSVWDPMRFQGEPSMSSPLRICAALCAEAGWECEHSNQSKPTWTTEWMEVLWRNYCMVNTYMYVLYVVYIYIYVHYVWTIFELYTIYVYCIIWSILELLHTN